MLLFQALRGPRLLLLLSVLVHLCDEGRSNLSGLARDIVGLRPCSPHLQCYLGLHLLTVDSFSSFAVFTGSRALSLSSA